MSLKILPLSGDPQLYQNCSLPKNARDSKGNPIDRGAWISLPSPFSSESRILAKVSEIRVNDNVSNVIRRDLRICKLSQSPASISECSSRESHERLEINLASHVVNLVERQVFAPIPDPEHLSKSGGSGGSNDIRVLQSDTITRITLTVIFGENGKEGGEMRELCTSALLQEKVRDILDVHDMRVADRALVDVRRCPLSQTSFSLPSISFLFVQDCEFAGGENGAKASELIGKVTTRTQIVVEATHDLNYYQRLFHSAQPPTVVTSGGMQSSLKLLEDIIKLQEETRRRREEALSKPGEESDQQAAAAHFSGGLLIAGAAGCGKSLVVRETARKSRSSLFVLDVASEMESRDLSRLLSTYTKLFAQAVSSARVSPSLVLLQRLELLSPSKSSGGALDSLSSRIKGKLVSHLCQLLDALPPSISLTVVATSSSPHLLPLAFRRPGRLQQEIYINLPTESERFQILQSLTRKLPSFAGLDLESLAMRTPGYTGADLDKLVHAINLKTSEEGLECVREGGVKYGLSRVLPASVRSSFGGGLIDIQRGGSLDDIAGLHSVKLELIKAIVWPLKFPNAFLTMGIQPPKGILLYGPPGCAKTSLVRALASSHQTNFLAVTAAELFSSGVGDSEKIVTELFSQARLASPCILFVDELEAVVGSRQASGKGANESVLSTFLTEMDGVGTAAEIASSLPKDGNSLSGPRVIVVAATNRPDLIDSALLRPGRLDRIIPVPPPSESERLELLVKCTASIRLCPDVNLEELASATHLYSGADLVNLCKEAALLALAEDMNIAAVSRRHFMEAKAQSTPSLSSKSLQLFHEYSRHL